MSRRVIGLFGGTGAGKSQAARWLAGRGARIIDADAVSREVSAPGGSAYQELRAAFPDCFRPDGELDRKKLGKRVFADESERQRLESIVHPHMRRRIRQLAADAGEDLVVLDCALLLHPSFRDLADEKWLITAPAAVRGQRIQMRDHLTPELVRDRIAAQTPDEELRRHADRVIENDSTEQEFFQKLEHEFAEENQNI